MDNSQEPVETATKIFIEGGNNADRIGGSSTVIFHQNEQGQIARVMYDCGALFAPENVETDAFVANVCKYLNIDDKSLSSAYSGSSQIEINRIREKYKSLGVASKKLDALFVTHMHEDHIGGIIKLMQAGFKFPTIYSSKETTGVIRRRCRLNGITCLPDMKVVKPYEMVKINGNVSISAIPVSHSAVGAYAFYTETKYNDDKVRILNMGDYNTEKAPLGEGFDAEKFAEFMKDKPLDLILLDSTSASGQSALSQNPITHEESVANLRKIMEEYPDKRIIAPIISGSLQNLYNYLEAARQLKRIVFIDGFMQRQNVDEVASHDVLAAYKDTIYQYGNSVNADAKSYLSQVPIGKQVIMQSGASAEGEKLKGEPTRFNMRQSGFVSLVNGTNKNFGPELLADAVVPAAQRAIPVGSILQRLRQMYSKAAQLGAVIIQTTPEKGYSLGDYRQENLQRTGHAVWEETLQLIDMLSENCKDQGLKAPVVVPCHGSVDQLLKVSKLLDDQGINRCTPINGNIMHVAPGYVKVKPCKQDKNNSNIVWLGFTEIPNQFGQNEYLELSIWEEIPRKGGVTYKKLETIGTIPVKDGKSKLNSYSHYDTKKERMIEQHEDDIMHESMHKATCGASFKNYRTSGRGGR